MYKILEKKDEDGLVYAVQEDSDPHPQVRVLHLNNLLSCQGFQGFENTNIQAQIPSKSAQTRGAKRKEHQRVSNYLESTDCSGEDEKVYFRSRFTRSQHQSLQKEKDLQSSADISSDNSRAKKNSQRYSRDHHQQRQSKNSPEQAGKTYHRVESEKPAACSQSQESEYQPRVIKTIEITHKDSLSTVGRTEVQRNFS